MKAFGMIASPNPFVSGRVEDNTDARLLPAFQAILNKQFDLLSLDCFDTLLYRKVTAPADLFEILSMRLQEKGLLKSHILPKAFKKVREDAEKMARLDQFDKIQSGEVPLRTIWANMPVGLFTTDDRDQLLAAEIDCEFDLLRFDQNVLNLALFAQNQGLKTAILSDTYFERAHMERFLNRPSGQFTPDHLLLSSDFGTSKANGMIGVLGRLTDTPNDRILHMGDAPHADVEPCQKVGMASLYYPKETPYSKACLFREFEYGQKFATSSAFDPIHGDFGLTSLRIKNSFDLRSGRHEDGREKATELSAMVMAPVFSFFAIWLKERAKQLGHNHLYCLMREGRWLKQLIDHDKVGPDITTSELWASRYALTRANIFEGTIEELQRFFDRPFLVEMDKAEKELGLDEGDLDFFREKHGNVLQGPDAVVFFFDSLVSNPDLKTKIVNESAKWRRNYIDYLRKNTGIDRGEPLCVVDLGYSGTIQRGLGRVLAAEGYGHIKIHGLYLLTTAKISEVYNQGQSAEGYLGNMGQPAKVIRSIYRSPETYEQICMPDVGSLLGFEDDGNPVLDSYRVDADQYAEVEHMRKSVASFQENLHRAHRIEAVEGTVAPDVNNPVLISHLQNMASELLMLPNELDLEIVGRWHHDENYSSDRMRNLLDEECFAGRLAHTTVREIAETASYQCYWPIGVAAKKDLRLAEAVRRVSLGESSADSADGIGGEGKATIYFDTGEGFGKCSKAEPEYKLNPSGKAWVSANVTTDGIIPAAIGISIGDSGDLVRLDKIRFYVQLKDNSRHEYDAEPDHLEKYGMWLNATAIQPNMAQIDKQPSIFSYIDLERYFKDARAVSIEVCFSMLKGL